MNAPKLKLILCNDWRSLIKEINRQLKCHDIIITAKSRPQDDMLTVSLTRPKRKRPNFGNL